MMWCEVGIAKVRAYLLSKYIVDCDSSHLGQLGEKSGDKERVSESGISHSQSNKCYFLLLKYSI